MSHKTAFRIFPIVHQYGMQLMIEWCVKAFQRNLLDLWPSEPIASSEVPNHPGLIQCLALADAKQCDSLVLSCLSQLIKLEGSSSDQMLRKALVSPSLNHFVGSLRPETKDKIILGLVGLQPDFKVSAKILGWIKLHGSDNKCFWWRIFYGPESIFLNSYTVYFLFFYIKQYCTDRVMCPRRQQSLLWGK